MSPSINAESATRRGVTEQAAVAAIDSGTRVLRLPTIRDRFEEIAARRSASNCPTWVSSLNW